ncbi:hypothetical protein BDA99DRAFT_554970 [Phascolomyces articulosus]|uniref:FAS1 domain-containing protein n=1 Tax=Phascolomyces articulosus TaxID=60185 RepID=A0AAD5KAU4_9FUNG|nr:hypothetical protein BDA99DRAFT_554970 [Phascolomyces articulosus]
MIRSVCCLYSNFIVFYIILMSLFISAFLPLHNRIVAVEESKNDNKDITIIQYQDATNEHQQQQKQITITTSSSSSSVQTSSSEIVKSIIEEMTTRDPRTTIFGQLVTTESSFDTFRHYLAEFKNISILVPWNDALVSHATIQQVLNNNLYFLLDNTQQQPNKENDSDDNVTVIYNNNCLREEDAQLQIKTTLLNHTKIKLRIKGSASPLGEEQISHNDKEEVGYVNVIGEPIIVNNDVIIYIIDQVPSVPKDVLQTLQELHQNMAYGLFQNWTSLLLLQSPHSNDNNDSKKINYPDPEKQEQQLEQEERPVVEGELVVQENKNQQVTIFAPINSAFGTVNPNLLSDNIRDQLASWHIIPGITCSSEQWSHNKTIELKNLNDENLEIRNGQLWLDPKPIQILTSDIILSNGGILHIIDQVVWMKQQQQQQQQPYVGELSSIATRAVAAQTRLIPITVLLYLIGLTLFGIPVL